MEPVLDDVNEGEDDVDGEGRLTDTDQERDQSGDAEHTDGEESNTTPSQSRSSSMHPGSASVSATARPPKVLGSPGAGDDGVDVFDGYSFKGRHSVLLDDEEEEAEDSEEDGDVETDEDEGGIAAAPLEGDVEPAQPHSGVEEDEEPKTPEARPVGLPKEETVVPEAVEVERPVSIAPSVTPEPVEPRPQKSKDLPRPVSMDVAPAIPEKETAKARPVHTKPVAQPAKGSRFTRPRREKSGVPALDRYLSDAVDEDAATERDDDEDDDWDIIEAADGEDRNGAKGPTLFSRGVVDRYRLAVFGKVSTPSRSNTTSRSFSGMSKESDAPSDVGESPSPSQRRGRTPGLTFRKHPRQFLRPKEPPSTFSSKSSSINAKSMSQSNSKSLSTSSSSGLIVPSSSMGSTSLPGSPSLKSKESAISVGAQSYSSDQSGNGDVVENMDIPRSTVPEEPEKQKNKKLKKYKENAEKVFSLFSSSSPRQQAS